MLQPVQDLVFATYTKRTGEPSWVFEEFAAEIVTLVAARCAAIASELEDDDRTAGAVWEAIRIEFGLAEK